MWRGTKVDDAGGQRTDNGYVLIATKGLVRGVVHLEDTEEKGEATLESLYHKDLEEDSPRLGTSIDGR